MGLVDSGRAIGAVTKLLREHLIRRGFAVSVGRPEQAATTDRATKLNLFLYEANFDGSLKNVALQDDQPPPLWLALKYLITAFDDSESSDSAEAHELLGRGVSALHELNYLRLDSMVGWDVTRALENSPEPLKVTFDESPADLLSKVMQGSDEKYRLSVAFQVRPVMIVPGEPPSYSLLVGVDYTETPPEIIGREGVGLAVLASLGPRLRSASPERFEAGETITVLGVDLHLVGLECLLASSLVSVVGQRPDSITVLIEGPVPGGATEGPIAAGTALSAGEHPLMVRQRMPNGRYRSSNLLVGRLLPIVETAGVDGTGALNMAGRLLGTADDDVVVALYRDGRVTRLFDTVMTGTGQKTLTVPAAATRTTPGTYHAILRVNGQQARRSPTVTFS